MADRELGARGVGESAACPRGGEPARFAADERGHQGRRTKAARELRCELRPSGSWRGLGELHEARPQIRGHRLSCERPRPPWPGRGGDRPFRSRAGSGRASVAPAVGKPWAGRQRSRSRRDPGTEFCTPKISLSARSKKRSVGWDSAGRCPERGARVAEAPGYGRSRREPQALG